MCTDYIKKLDANQEPEKKTSLLVNRFTVSLAAASEDELEDDELDEDVEFLRDGTRSAKKTNLDRDH